MLKKELITTLQKTKNLLAFSAGGDSTALFFLLIQHNIPFDIAIVDYNIRKQSKEEVAYAKLLAKQYNLQCHIFQSPKINNNFEANARKIRYDFFETLIQKYSYTHLLTAHHLGDRFEWMLMQFCKGAGCVELSGMQQEEKKSTHTIIRPLLDYDKTELLTYLHKHNIQYFFDETNNDTTIKRNEFRHNYTTPLLQKYLQGIKKSFQYIDEDRKNLITPIQITTIKDFAYFLLHNQRSNIYAIDQYLKQNNLMMSASEKTLLKQQTTTIIARKFVVTFTQKYCFIAPFLKDNTPLPKEFKEECRKRKIEPKLRKYLYQNNDVFQIIKSKF